jgi:phage baseplate assembly protein W
VKEALMRHEPRIELLNVQTSTDKLAGGILDIHLDYRIRSTNTEFNMVYPFYLKAGGE